MNTQEFFFVYGWLMVTMLACRCIPMFVLKGRNLPERVSDILRLIPTAAFAALVANDLFSPGMFDAGLVGAIPLVAAAIVAFVAAKTRSLVGSVVVGVVAYALLTLV